MALCEILENPFYASANWIDLLRVDEQRELAEANSWRYLMNIPVDCICRNKSANRRCQKSSTALRRRCKKESMVKPCGAEVAGI